MSTAFFIKEREYRNGWGPVVQRLYRLDPPLEGAEHVVVSAAVIAGEPETYIFAANKEGWILDFSELTGSVKGTLSHLTALQRAGYEAAA